MASNASLQDALFRWYLPAHTPVEEAVLSTCVWADGGDMPVLSDTVVEVYGNCPSGGMTLALVADNDNAGPESGCSTLFMRWPSLGRWYYVHVWARS